MNKRAIKKIKKVHDDILFDKDNRPLFRVPRQYETGASKTIHWHPVNPFKEMKRHYLANGGGHRGLIAARRYAVELVYKTPARI